MTIEIRALQIFYNPKTRALLDADFEPFDNSKNERPDWFEYWPIRTFLSENRLTESAYYGFLSPLFFRKTGLTGRKVMDFLRQAGDADVVTFSPWPCHASVFVNVFEHGEFFHQGLYDLAGRFLGEFGRGAALDALVTHSRNTVFSNFFFAKPKFWAVWKSVLDRLFELAEAPASPLYAELNKPLDYEKDDGTRTVAQMKVFVMERAVSFLLASNEAFTVRNFPPFEMPLSPPFAGYLPGVVMLDAFKIAFSKTRDPWFLRCFKEERNKALAAIWPGRSPRL